MLQSYREASKYAMVYGLEIPVTYIFSGLEKAVYWIKKKIFQETDFDDNMRKKMSQMNYSDFFFTFVRILEKF